MRGGLCRLVPPQQVTHGCLQAQPKPRGPHCLLPWPLPFPSTRTFSTCDFSPSTLFLNTRRREHPRNVPQRGECSANLGGPTELHQPLRAPQDDTLAPFPALPALIPKSIRQLHLMEAHGVLSLAPAFSASGLPGPPACVWGSTLAHPRCLIV